jgi:Flp pilus assembly protein TadG
MTMGARRESRGQGLVEFALVFPIAILIILAVFDIGRAVFIHNGLTNAAREGARLAIVNQDIPSVEERVQDMAVGTAVTNLGDGTLVRFFKQLPNADPTTNPACSPIATGCIAVVAPQADWSAITPIIGSLIGPFTLEARSELPIEFVCPNSYYASCPKQP